MDDEPLEVHKMRNEIVCIQDPECCCAKCIKENIVPLYQEMELLEDDSSGSWLLISNQTDIEVPSKPVLQEEGALNHVPWCDCN